MSNGRLCRFTAVVSDRPGGLAELAQLSASSGASIQEIAHDRAFSGPDLASAHFRCSVETADRKQVRELYAALAAAGIEVLPVQERRK